MADPDRVAVAGSAGVLRAVYNRHRRWSGDGTWARVLTGLRRGCDLGEAEWTLGVDSTVVRAHEHAAGARHAPPVDVPAAALASTLDRVVGSAAPSTGG